MWYIRSNARIMDVVLSIVAKLKGFYVIKSKNTRNAKLHRVVSIKRMKDIE